jgi:hypothetical protein
MNCEYCESTHAGTYGTGRFCSSKCARGFSSKEKRKSINEKVSSALKGKSSKLKGRAGKKHDPETKERIRESLKTYYHIEHPEKVRTEEQQKARNVANVIAYRARKKNALAEDADLELIRKIYESRPEGYHVDHIKALARGGLHHQDNLQYLPSFENCRKCADRKYDETLAIDWRTIVK